MVSNNWHERALKDIENTLINVFSQDCASENLLKSMKYSTLDAGKRIRPLFCLASGVLSDADYKNILLIGSALEIIHCFSLIHDDLPIMDNDGLRRGKPTNHIVYGDAVALLAGDALHSLSFEILSSEKLKLSDNKKLNIICRVAKAIGINGMVGGQTIDWLSSGKHLTVDELKEMHGLKTGALLKASIITGYLAGDNYSQNVLMQMEIIADKIGLLFQIVDDIIDVTETTETLGKTANKDHEQDKATYVTILGLDDSKQLAATLHKEIINLLKQHDNSEILQYLTDLVYYRNN